MQNMYANIWVSLCNLAGPGEILIIMDIFFIFLITYVCNGIDALCKSEVARTNRRNKFKRSKTQDRRYSDLKAQKIRKEIVTKLVKIRKKNCHKNSPQKGLIILPTAGGVLADFWVPNEIDSLNFQHMLLF